MYQIFGIVLGARVDISDNTVFMYQIFGIVLGARVDISDNTVFMYQISGIIPGTIMRLIFQITQYSCIRYLA